MTGLFFGRDPEPPWLGGLLFGEREGCGQARGTTVRCSDLLEVVMSKRAEAARLLSTPGPLGGAPEPACVPTGDRDCGGPASPNFR